MIKTHQSLTWSHCEVRCGLGVNSACLQSVQMYALYTFLNLINKSKRVVVCVIVGGLMDPLLQLCCCYRSVGVGVGVSVGVSEQSIDGASG